MATHLIFEQFLLQLVIKQKIDMRPDEMIYQIKSTLFFHSPQGKIDF